MSGRERLERYLRAVRRRLRIHIYVQTVAACALAALLITIAAVWLLQRESFASAVTLGARVALAAALIATLVLCALRPLMRLHRNDGADVLEERLPEQHGRIRTYLDSLRTREERAASPLLELLAEDAAAIAESAPVQKVASNRRLAAAAFIGALAVAALALLLTTAPGVWGVASRHLLLGAELPREVIPERRIVVEPGDATVRRNSDLAIRAAMSGFNPQVAQVFVRYAAEAAWERAPMQASSQDGARFEFTLYAVRAPLAYYVEADGARSAEHTVGVVDLPKIERVRLTYQYPEWTGLEAVVDEQDRDIRAVAGTNVKVEVFADAPLEAPALIVDGSARELAREDRASVGAIAVEKPGRYQIGARVANEFVALSDEYTIEIAPDEKPTIEIVKPGRDWRATSIEEVPVRIAAQDDFRLRQVELRYSVNGGEWRSTPLGGGVKQSDKASLLRLEELGAQGASEQSQLVPGDLVSYYAVAKDRKNAVQTDLYMVQVQPFERRFAQAQAGAAGGGMTDDQGAISERQREILLATWNLQRNDERNARSRAQLEDNAQMLAELQGTLAHQARTLAERTRARASLDDERVRTFVESLMRAAESMEPAARSLSEFKLAEAVPSEQQALQQLLRAESAFRDVQVSMQQDQQGGGAQSARNFTEMFELEMDLEKNQYESESQASLQTAEQELAEAIRKLKELAERQERLAQESQRSDLKAQEQRWKQEQLRREAEDLRRRLAELQRQQQQQQGSPSASAQRNGARGQPSSQSSGAQGEQQSSETPRDSRESELAQALESVNRALQEMRTANERPGEQGDESRDAARKAGQNLRRALKDIDRPAPSGLDETLEQLAERTRDLSDEQRRIESDLYQALSQSGGDQFGGRGSLERRKAQELVQSKQQLGSDLSELQQDMRGAVHEHRTRRPESAKRVSEILRDLEKSNVMYRVNRSAAEIYYGRARDAAMREGLISEALENLERDLREAAALAAREGQGARDDSASEQLLAEVAEMRRALEAGSSEGGDTPQTSQSGAEGGASAQTSQRGAPSSGDSPRGGLQDLTREGWDGRGALARETAVIGQRVREAANRLSRADLTAAELDALRRRANELRRLSGDPMAERKELLALVDQIELAALAAASEERDPASARATSGTPDSPRYREAVAEYYRRLGSK